MAKGITLARELKGAHMKSTRRSEIIGIVVCLMTFSVSALSQQTKPTAAKTSPTIAVTMDTQLTSMEKQFVPAAEAMPGDKYSFVPDGEAFKGSRTFALEVRH